MRTIGASPRNSVRGKASREMEEEMSLMPDFGQCDSTRVDEFLREFKKLTRRISVEQRSQELDERIRRAELSLADKIEAFKRLAPSADVTDRREELRMERLLLSVALKDLHWFKFALEYDGDYKDLVEYVFHDIDDQACQARIIGHLRTAQPPIGVKVLSDVDDTMYANLIDARYPKKTLYPGALEFYDAVKREPFELSTTPVTTLSARPNPIAGTLEESSLQSLVAFTKGRLCLSALSGALVSGALGTAQTVLRANLDLLCDEGPHDQEDEIGRVKFKNFLRFSAVYPEYRYVFVGDSGQADALAAQLMVTTESTEETSRVVTTFIHDLRQFENDAKSASSAFRGLRPEVLVNRGSAAGRGVIVFRNYIDAAVVAYTHSATLEHLISAEGLASITRSALRQFQDIDFHGKEASEKRLREQYRQDAEEAHRLLAKEHSLLPALEEDVQAIRHILDGQFS
jgi:hypothetical protein